MNVSKNFKWRLNLFDDNWLSSQNLTALIWFVVNVPVLSEQMTEVHPKVSTEGSFLTMAFCFAIFLVPSAKHVVITAGKPSGIAATANATAILK
mgnify:CR=1 FL=1